MSDVGVKRVSIGGALARVVLGAMIDAGEEMLERGTFTWLEKAASGRRLVDMFK